MIWGPDGTVDATVALLEAKLPTTLATFRTILGATIEQLPDPGAYKPVYLPRPELADYPLVAVQYMDLGRLTFLNQQGGQLTLWAPHHIRVYTVVRGNGFIEVEWRRKQYFKAILSTLLSNVTLSTSPSAWFDFKTASGSFSAMTGKQDSRSIAATYVDLTVMVEEMTDAPGPPLGTADKIVSVVAPGMR